jgi:uncharacterized damage-inducible protein DinB
MISTSLRKPVKTPKKGDEHMKEMLTQLAAYNLWANQKLLELINQLPAEKHHAEWPSSFKSLYATILHMWDAESIWFQRVKMHERFVVPSENFNGTMQDTSNGLLQQNHLWLDFASNSSEAALEHVFQYYNSKKEHFKQPVWQVMMHVFNHGTYHRGQLVNMLRQGGVEKIPQTDLVVFSRLKK